jgi:DNA-directed RNA polymerase subunit RPC12/RpoP
MEYKCLQCKKNYASYKSLWNHNDKFHKSECNENVKKRQIDVKKMSIKKMDIIETINYSCINCKKPFKSRQGKWVHEKTCNNIKEDKIDIVMKENIEMKKEMEKLKDMLQKALKIHPKTLTKINKQLNNTNNGIINNNIIVQLGRENLSDILSSKEKMGILNRQAMGINDLIELVHASGKYKQFMNVCITNLQNTIAYKFDEKANSFIAVNKNELLNDLVDSRVYDIEKFFDEYQTKFDAKKVEQIKKFIERMSNEEDSLKGIKKEEIKLILYNNLEKIKSNENDIIKIDDKELEI